MGRLATRTNPRPLHLETLEDRCVLSTMVALTAANQILTFDSDDPADIYTRSTVNGLRPGEDLIGIDVRPATGEVYGVSDRGRIYTLDPFTGAATFKVLLQADPADTSSPFMRSALRGGSFGIDFNPTNDRLRIVSNSAQNLRVDVDTGLVTTDPRVRYDSGATAGVVGSAYTNPDNDDGTGTTLYGLDFRRDLLVTQDPTTGRLQFIGRLGLNVKQQVGFDIGLDGTAYAALTKESTGESHLYEIDLTDGSRSLIGSFATRDKIEGLAELLPYQNVYAVTAANELIRFNSARPDLLTLQVDITGLAVGETVAAIDFRPDTGDLYALGSTGQIYTINTTTGQATAEEELAADPADTTAPFVALAGTSFGFDFNPTVDRVRITSDADENVRADVDTGLVTTDDPLAYAAGDPNAGADPNVVASAYSDNFSGTTTTTLYGIDSELDILVTQDPTTGELTTVGDLGVVVTDVASFDISGGGDAYAALMVEGETNTGFYTIDTATGTATLVGIIGETTVAGGVEVTALSVSPALVQFLRPATLVAENGNQEAAVAIRTGDTTGTVSVNFTTTDGTAEAGADYTTVNTLLTFEEGTTVRLAIVTITPDDEVEGFESIQLELTTPVGGSGATVTSRSRAEMWIDDADDNADAADFWTWFGGL